MTTPLRPPKDNLVRAFRPGVELRAAEDGTPPTMFGHFAVFNRWTEIESFWEGHFMERLAPGAFKKSFRSENSGGVKVLFQHGMDPQIGDKPLGRHKVLREDEIGAYYEVPLLDARYVREDIQPGLEADLYGASFRFRVMQEDIRKEPKPSDDNPKGLPERTIREVELFEFGPVTFPAYADATAGVRSMTDAYVLRTIFGRVEDDPARAKELIETIQAQRIFPSVELTVETGAEPHLDEARSSGEETGAEPHLDTEERGEPATPVAIVKPTPRKRFHSREEYLEWISRT